MAERGSERQAATWRGLPGYQVASDHVSVVVVPSRGAKIVSLYDVRAGRELLSQPASDAVLRPLTYGALWAAYETSGWDEVFPTLGECDHPGPGRSKGVRLPDHGEVWGLAWSDETPGHGAEVVCSAVGVAVPYLLRRTLSLDGPRLRLRYELRNTSDDPLPFQWLPHPLVVDASALAFEWDAHELPWSHTLDSGLVVPATADGPDVAVAVEAGRAPLLAPGHAAAWSTTVTVGGEQRVFHTSR